MSSYSPKSSLALQQTTRDVQSHLSPPLLVLIESVHKVQPRDLEWLSPCKTLEPCWKGLYPRDPSNSHSRQGSRNCGWDSPFPSKGRHEWPEKKVKENGGECETPEPCTGTVHLSVPSTHNSTGNLDGYLLCLSS